MEKSRTAEKLGAGKEENDHGYHPGPAVSLLPGWFSWVLADAETAR
jgi:hypothetical protein